MNPPNFVKVPLGKTVATPAALDALTEVDILNALGRHSTGDWGDVTPDDGKANDDALKSGGRLLSVYRSDGETVFWIITEADRSATTVLLPDDY